MPTNCVVPNSGNLYFNGTAGGSGGVGNLTIVSGVLDQFEVTMAPETGLTGANLTILFGLAGLNRHSRLAECLLAMSSNIARWP